MLAGMYNFGIGKMFLEDRWHNNRFAESTRYNVDRTKSLPPQSSPCPGARPVDPDNPERHSLLNDEDMTNSMGAPDSAAGGGDPLLLWRRIAQQLCPLIGASGFCALFGRAAHVVGPEHAWLVEQPCRSPEQLFSFLEKRLAGVDAQRAAAANEALLRTFTQLLAALIGERLTQRLLASATATAEPAPGQQTNVQEQK